MHHYYLRRVTQHTHWPSSSIQSETRRERSESTDRRKAAQGNAREYPEDISGKDHRRADPWSRISSPRICQFENVSIEIPRIMALTPVSLSPHCFHNARGLDPTLCCPPSSLARSQLSYSHQNVLATHCHRPKREKQQDPQSECQKHHKPPKF